MTETSQQTNKPPSQGERIDITNPEEKRPSEKKPEDKMAEVQVEKKPESAKPVE